MVTIESLQNTKIKYLTRLITDNRFRKKEGVFVVEGKQENERALQYQYQPKDIFICNEIYKNTFDGKYNPISTKIYEKLAYRDSSEGIIGIYKVKQNDLKDFKPKENSSIIIVESIEKPGNLGAILRSCEAFGIDALIITDTKVDFFNPNVIRSSVGCLFGMNFFQSDNETVLEFLTTNNYNIFTTIMHHNSKNIVQVDLTKKSALLFGTEHSGLSSFWNNKGTNVLIPMKGSIDSLNLSNAVAITCYEILKQKE